MLSLFNRFTIHSLLKQVLKPKPSNAKCFSSTSDGPSNSDSESEENFFDRSFDDLTVDSFKSLATDPQTRQKIEVILNEYEYEKYTTLRVPTTLSADQMRDLLALKESLDRKKWFNYLFTKQMARNKSNEKRRQHSVEYWSRKKTEYDEKRAERTGLWDREGQLIYGLWHNTLFSKISKTSINRYCSHRLMRAALFGPKLVIDLDYDECMKLSECRLLVQQLQLIYSYNRYQTVEPFDLHFTNCKPSMPTMQAIPKLMPNYKSPNFISPFESKSYLDLFPKEQLIYLSPHSPEPLKSVDGDHIYIIGGIIDKTFHEPITYIKAQKEGIRSARLPIDEHVLWASGSKYLCLNHMVAILHDVYMTGNWRQSLKDNIPMRKQKRAEEIEYEDMLRRQRLKRYEKRNKSMNAGQR